MAVGSLLRCLVSPAGGVAAWLPCHELLATPYSGWQHWFSSLRLRRRLQASPRAAPRLRRPSRGPLHRLLLHGSHAPPGRPRRRRKGSIRIRRPLLFCSINLDLVGEIGRSTAASKCKVEY
jgi:hypothetical protein